MTPMFVWVLIVWHCIPGPPVHCPVQSISDPHSTRDECMEEMKSVDFSASTEVYAQCERRPS